MPVLIDTNSEEAKERRKWEMFHTEYGPPGRPYEQVRSECHWPVMLYRAQPIPGSLPGAGKIACGTELPSRHLFNDDQSWERACEAVNHFARSCQRIVNDETEYKRAKAEGFCDTSLEAVAAAEKEQHYIAEVAAHRAYEDRNMSDAAKAEVAKAEAEHFGHLPAVPEAPRVKRKYTRRAKPVPPAA